MVSSEAAAAAATQQHHELTNTTINRGVRKNRFFPSNDKNKDREKKRTWLARGRNSQCWGRGRREAVPGGAHALRLCSDAQRPSRWKEAWDRATESLMAPRNSCTQYRYTREKRERRGQAGRQADRLRKQGVFECYKKPASHGIRVLFFPNVQVLFSTPRSLRSVSAPTPTPGKMRRVMYIYPSVCFARDVDGDETWPNQQAAAAAAAVTSATIPPGKKTKNTQQKHQTTRPTEAAAAAACTRLTQERRSIGGGGSRIVAGCPRPARRVGVDTTPDRAVGQRLRQQPHGNGFVPLLAQRHRLWKERERRNRSREHRPHAGAREGNT